VRPVIGITMSFDKGELIRPGVSYNMIRREYGEQLRAAGASPIFLDHSIDPKHAAELCDAIVISGGEDIHPSFYGQDPVHIKTQEPHERTSWERLLIDACDRQSIKILGICYGSQLLNIHYGGTLYQDIAKETGSNLDHGKTEKPAVHHVKFRQDFLGFKNGDVVESASRHHQAVKDIAPGFSEVAHANDGIIEAITGYGHYGIQWHSESDSTADNIYGSFVHVITQNNRVKLTS
jgi:gamma-glutamyl-gamma-aminobutyrate hydrolase PuuD